MSGKSAALDEAAATDTAGDRLRRGPVGGARDLNLEQSGRSLAVGGNLSREGSEHGREGSRKGLGTLVALDVQSTRPVGEGEHHVVGGRVTVHGDRVERLVSRLAQESREQCRCHRGICAHEAEGGRHVGVDHSRSLGNPE